MTSTNILIAGFLLSLTLGACSRASSSDPSSDAGSSAAPAASATAKASSASPVAGPLTRERLIAANGKVKKGDPWKAARETLIRELGAPTSEGAFVDWGVTTGDSCTMIRLESSGDVVSEVSTAVTYTRSSRDEFDDCFAKLDRMPADKNPAAPGPAAGKVHSVSELLDGMNEARSKWAGQTVRVRGRVRSVVRSGGSKDYTLASMSITDEKDESKRVGVQITQDVKSAPRDGQHVVIVAEGVVQKRGDSIDKARIVR